MSTAKPPLNVATNADIARSRADALARMAPESCRHAPHGNGVSAAGMVMESGLQAQACIIDIGPAHRSLINLL
ncbi:hypothetical protein NRY68_11055 [Acidithiobacillus ferrooxidans]|uniref:hypothetical protein n=1 Tax=Acidithiobacillus ferrooxidans TaxID=920 RepID=UPI0021475F4D|nr:hypothetical protein [Acidithiobacillus ferrooxidans]MCR1346309.1 hypothetical protein [Acidithiobacillus ferrooxidans]MCR1354402.1 hypothetical protein [Acidithiobacillus ferrooxidans]